MSQEQIHGTCVAIDGLAVLIRGSSGAGKSDVALRLMDKGATLVADDRVNLTLKNETLEASPPNNLAGKLEVRGIGIIERPYVSAVPISLVVDLASPSEIDRMPEAQTVNLHGVILPLTRLTPFEASTPLKVKLALQIAHGDIIVTR